MSYCLKRPLARETNIQEVSVPDDAVPVAFLNRGGEATVYFTSHLVAEGAGKKAQPPHKTVRLILTNGAGQTPVAADYIGTAEFSGGQVLYHCWMLPNG